MNKYHNTSSVTTMLENLGWISLEKRREDSRLVLMYKLHCNLVDFPVYEYIVPLTGHTRTRSTHTAGYQIPQCRTELYKQSFFPRTVRAWNALPSSSINACNPIAFRQSLTEGRS